MNPLYDSMMRANPQDEQLSRLKADPVGMVRQAGYQIPDGLAGNPQAIVQHLISSGQVGGPIMQRIQPMIRMLTGR